MDSPESMLIIHASEHASFYIKELEKRWPGLLIIHVLGKNPEPAFKFFGLDGEINPVSGRYEIAQYLLDKLSEEEQQKLYELLHSTYNRRIYK